MGKLVNIDDVVNVVDKHTDEENRLDEDISVILEEINSTCFTDTEIRDNLTKQIQADNELIKQLKHDIRLLEQLIIIRDLQDYGITDKSIGEE